MIEPISWQIRIGRYFEVERLTSDSHHWVTNRPRDGSIDEAPGVILPNHLAGFFVCIETLSTFRRAPRPASRIMRERGTRSPAKELPWPNRRATTNSPTRSPPSIPPVG